MFQAKAQELGKRTASRSITSPIKLSNKSAIRLLFKGSKLEDV
jgi:hypothetical protein